MGDDGLPVFLSNHAGGVLGGLSTGQPLTARIAFKPTSSILTPRQTITRDGEETEGRGLHVRAPDSAIGRGAGRPPYGRLRRPALVAMTLQCHGRDVTRCAVSCEFCYILLWRRLWSSDG